MSQRNSRMRRAVVAVSYTHLDVYKRQGWEHKQGAAVARLPDTRLTGDAGRKRQVTLVDHQPAGQQLFENLPVPDPFLVHGHGLCQVQGDALDGDGAGGARLCVR